MSWLRSIALTISGYFILALTLGMLTLLPVQAQTNQRCFTETNQCLSGRIREFWEQNGGLPVFGYPITAQREEEVEGKRFQVQWFQRNRMELHPENSRPYDVLLGRLGDQRLIQQQRNWTTFARVTGTVTGCLYFNETGHSLCEPFLSYFKSNGLEFEGLTTSKSLAENLALFGLPLSQPTTETNQAGATVNTQWFERARFEHHPQNPPTFQVLLGLLGNEIRSNSTVLPTATPTPTTVPTITPVPTPTPSACSKVPAPVSSTITPGRCIKAGTIITIDIFGFKANEQIGYWLTSPDGIIVTGTEETSTLSNEGKGQLTDSTGDLESGLWSWVFEGTSSKHQAIVYFLIE